MENNCPDDGGVRKHSNGFRIIFGLRTSPKLKLMLKPTLPFYFEYNIRTIYICVVYVLSEQR